MVAKVRSAPAAVTVSAGGESVTVHGRAAVIIWLVVKYAKLINATVVGRVVIHFGGAKANLELCQSLPAVRCEL